MHDDVGCGRCDEAKHLFGPEAELGCFERRVSGFEEDMEDVVVHLSADEGERKKVSEELEGDVDRRYRRLLGHEGFVPLPGIETVEIVLYLSVERGLGREAIAPIAGVDRVQRTRRHSSREVGPREYELDGGNKEEHARQQRLLA
jgi:hypothetical protein